MRKLILILSLATGLFVSCGKDNDNITVVLNGSGDLKVKVVDEENNAVNSAKVSVYSSIPEGERIFFDSTNASGICDLGKVIQGQYMYYVYAKKGKMTYSTAEYFQVITGETKTLEVNPFLNVGNLSIRIIDNQMNPVGFVNVALVPHARYSNVTYFFEDLKEEAYFDAMTNSDGWVTFDKVPTGAMYGLEYSVLVYFDSSEYDYPYSNNGIYVYRDTERKYTIQVDL